MRVVRLSIAGFETDPHARVFKPIDLRRITNLHQLQYAWVSLVWESTHTRESLVFYTSGCRWF